LEAAVTPLVLRLEGLWVEVRGHVRQHRVDLFALHDRSPEDRGEGQRADTCQLSPDLPHPRLIDQDLADVEGDDLRWWDRGRRCRHHGRATASRKASDTSRSHNAPKDRSAAEAARGTNDVSVMPGHVSISNSHGTPASSTMRSAREMWRAPTAS